MSSVKQPIPVFQILVSMVLARLTRLRTVTIANVTPDGLEQIAILKILAFQNRASTVRVNTTDKPDTFAIV